MLTQLNTLLLYDAKIQDDTSSLLSLTMGKRLKSKQSSNRISQIHAKYCQEESQIQNKIDEVSKARKENVSEDGEEVDSNTRSELLSEYEELKDELKDLKNEEDREIEKVEKETTSYENDVEVQQSAIETDLQATREDRDAIKENLDQDIESTFGYFK